MKEARDDEREALIARFDALRGSGVCSPTTRGLLDDAERLLRKHPEPEITDEAIRQAVLDGLAGASVLQSPFAPQLRALVVEQITLSLRAALRVPVGEGEI